MSAERIRTAWARVRRRERLDSGDACGEPWSIAFAGLQPDPAETVAVPAAEAPGAPPVPRHDGAGTELVTALRRVADSFERVAESLDADRRERRETLGDLDSLLRELVSGLRPSGAAEPTVIGGTIDVTGADVDLRPQPEPR